MVRLLSTVWFIAANAVSVGANTVYGPEPFNVSVRPVVFSAPVSLVKLPLSCAVCTTPLPEVACEFKFRLRPDNATAAKSAAATTTTIAAVIFLSIISHEPSIGGPGGRVNAFYLRQVRLDSEPPMGMSKKYQIRWR